MAQIGGGEELSDHNVTQVTSNILCYFHVHKVFTFHLP